MEPTHYTGIERRAPAHDAIRAAVAEGIRDAVGDPAVWEAAGKAMREQAQSAAGGWLLGGVRVLLARVTWVVAIMAGVYALGGWHSLVAFIKAGAKP